MAFGIYELTQQTWEDGRTGDFNLPRTLRYYATREAAERGMTAHIEARRQLAARGHGYEHTTANDYTITAIEVLEMTDGPLD